ncbi:chaperone [Lithospermum erythrorhizon]|uniref:Chaperone n=1 Tax=Lithospermum erythrorhizon TaxID=34254 RepID=A0AAV3RZP3_LITER
MAEEVVKVERQGGEIENTAEATIEGGGSESTCNNADREKSLQFSDELLEKAVKASKEQDYAQAAESYSRALEIRVAHFGELSPECVNTYYKYGCALLYKAQDESDPLGSVPKKEDGSEQDSKKDGSSVSVTNGESSISSTANKSGISNNQEKHPDGEEKNQDEESDTDDDGGDDDLAEAEADEDESDLDLAWKMLDLARAIVEKHSGDTMEKVDILSALAEVALEREDVETSLSDYLKALDILERLVEPDSRFIAELNFRICLCLEIGSKPQDAIPYCQKAISVCKSRVQRLSDEIKNFSGSTTTSEGSDSVKSLQRSFSSSGSNDSLANKEAEIETLTGLASELDKKLEDLQQLVSSPSSILADILGLVSAKVRGANNSDATCGPSSSRMGTANSSGDVDSPTLSTAHTSGAADVTHLGVVGRGVKRVNLNPVTQEAAKKPTPDPSANSGAGSAP